MIARFYIKKVITYPVLKLYDKYVYHDMYDRQIIININNEICEDVMEFKNSVKKQAIAYKKLYTEKISKTDEDYFKYQYEVYVNNEVTYDRDNIISIVMTKYEFTGGAHGMTYLDAYNYNLLTGGDEGFKAIIENQPFYIDEDGIVIYFGLYEIAPYYVGIPKFKLRFDEFSQYLNYN